MIKHTNKLFESICRTCFQNQHKKNLTVLKRRFEVPLAKSGEEPVVRPEHGIYDVVYVDTIHKTPPINCILTTHVDGYGERGDIVNIKRRIFRYELYPAGLAVYASPENIAEFEKEAEATKHIPKLSRYAYLTWLQLWGIHLEIPMSVDIPWSLNKTHVKVAFRLAGIEIDEDSISLPDEEITTPQDLSITITVNGIKDATVPATIYSVYRDESKNMPREPKPWLTREECYNAIKNRPDTFGSHTATNQPEKVEESS